MRPWTVLPALGLLLALAGCTSPRGTFALASSQVVPHQYVTVFGDRKWGEYCPEPLSLIFGLADTEQMYHTAARQALAQAPGANALIDVKIWITSRLCARVEGRPVTLR